jgi:hypothetical protein
MQKRMQCIELASKPWITAGGKTPADSQAQTRRSRDEQYFSKGLRFSPRRDHRASDGVMKTVLSSILIIFFLVSCGSKPQPSPPSPPRPGAGETEAGQFPQDYQTRIISWLRMNADDPDRVKVLSIEPPLPQVFPVSLPDKNLTKGEPVWESVVLTQGYSGDPQGPTYHRFYFKDGIIQAVDPK